MTNHIDGRGSALILVLSSPHFPLSAQPAPLLNHISFPPAMGDQSGSSRFQVLFESALKDYEMQTGISLTNHPLAQQVQICQTVESITDLLQEQARAFKEYQGSDKIMESLKSVVSFLSKVASTAALRLYFGMVYPRQPIGCSTSLIPI